MAIQPSDQPQVTDETAAAAVSTARRANASWFGWATVVGFAVTTLVLIGLHFVADRQLQPLTRNAYEAAWQRWQQNGPKSYQLEVEVTGRQAARYQVRVERGEAVSATRDGVPLKQHRVWFTWTVPGMFETIQRDLEQLERAQRGEPNSRGLTVLVFFDPELGYPVRYLRAEQLGPGVNPEAGWTVKQFDILPDTNNKPPEIPEPISTKTPD
jgi:hypothetical protein